MNATNVAVDLANNVFELAAGDKRWRVVERARLMRHARGAQTLQLAYRHSEHPPPNNPTPINAILPSLLLASALAGHAQGAELAGKVVTIQDGDTLTVLVSRQQIKVRLTDIDAPERKQPFGTRSRQSLSEICGGKTAQVDHRGKDRYGRTLGRVTCGHIDANTEQVRRGMAWVYTRYAPKDSPLYAVQAEAKTARRGLWVDANLTPPWEWREARR